ncbi:hypothetical protein QL989_19040 [Pseudoalteromonas sp. APC 3224]|uniref:hypothetical protein n=1 Tax=Pseudoalteromonas sp. APC 3224 TaxID=3035203 RepID=UPI0025B3AF7B|nr:hypothetical protein [Pseudoalteromonas sp. APC 3224]MDN3487439.1 hypothetical protein [Pseudoalteromonas sp. APC 3224]
MKLRYDSINQYKSPQELIFRLRLWTDPAFKKPPILMASQQVGWNGISVVNASEGIYSYFMSQDILASIKSEEQDVIKKITSYDLMGVLSKLQQSLSNGMNTAGNINDELSALMWLGPKIGPSLNDAKNHIIEYYNESEQHSLAFENVKFIEHYPSQAGHVQDWFTQEKFFVISYKEGFRDQECIVMTHDAMQREYGIKGI